MLTLSRLSIAPEPRPARAAVEAENRMFAGEGRSYAEAYAPPPLPAPMSLRAADPFPAWAREQLDHWRREGVSNVQAFALLKGRMPLAPPADAEILRLVEAAHRRVLR